MDDDVGEAPIYRGDGKAGQPVIGPHETHDLCMKWEPKQMKSQQKQNRPSKEVPKSGSLDTNTQNPRERDEHTWFVVKIRIEPGSLSLKEMTTLQLKDNSHLISE